MKIPKEFISHLAHEITRELVAAKAIDAPVDVAKLTEHIHAVIQEELSVEDRINDEVRQLLQQYEPDIRAGRLDYRKLFEMTKKKLIAEKKVIL